MTNPMELVDVTCAFCPDGRLVIYLSRRVGVSVPICQRCLKVALGAFEREMARAKL